MKDYFRESLEEIKRAGEHLVTASGHMQAAHEAHTHAMQALIHGTERVLDAHDEQEDLRDTVARLEKLVLELVDEVRKRNGHGGVA